MHSTHFIYGCMVSDMIKDHLDNKFTATIS